MTYSISVYMEFGAELEARWRNLESRADAYVFQSYDWNALWFDTIGKDSGRCSPCVAVVSSGDVPLVLFPFALFRRMGIKSLEMMGGDQADYLSPLVDQQRIGSLPLEKIRGMVLRSLPEYDSAVLTKMPGRFGTEANPFVELWPSRLSHEAFAATLPATWAEMEARIPKKLLADTRRQMRRLNERGEVSFRIADGENEYRELLELLFVQKRQRYRETGARDILAGDAAKDFYRRAHSALGNGYAAQMSALSVNGKVIATHWGVVHPTRYYWLMPAYLSGEMASYSPGRLLQEKLLQWCIGRQIALFDFTIGAEEYKKAWCDMRTDLYEHISVNSYRGALFRAQRSVIGSIKHSPRTRAAAMGVVKVLRRAQAMATPGTHRGEK